MNSNTSEFAKYLEKKMKDRNMSVNRLSEQLNLDKSYIYKWLKSERKPSVKKNHIDSIAKVLHLSVIEVQELREAFHLSIDGPESIEKRSLISNILKGLSFNINMSPKYFDVKQKNPTYSNGKDYILLEKNSFKSLITMLSDDYENFSSDECLYISISCSKLLEEQCFDTVINLLKLILEKGVHVTQIITLKKDSLYNLKVFNMLLPLILSNSPGTYTLKYFTQYDSMFSPEIIYTQRFAAVVLSSGTIIFKTSMASQLIKTEFENFSVYHTLPLVTKLSESTLYENLLPECFRSHGEVYSLMGFKHVGKIEQIRQQSSIKNFPSKFHKIFLESEAFDCIKNGIIPTSFDDTPFDKIEDFKMYVQKYFPANDPNQINIFVDENIYSPSTPVYFILKKGIFLILCLCPAGQSDANKKSTFLKITEKTLIETFDNFFSNILYKYE